jgi:glycosyltransferase involved in cell wall biosynthesis
LLHYPLERFLARFTDTLITLNDEDYRIAKRWTLRNGAPVVLCPGVGVSPRTAPQVALERSPIRVLMLAEFNTEKRHGDLVEAVGLLPRGLVHVLLAGAGPERDRVEAMVGARGLAEEVTFLGWVPNGSKLIGDADIVVLPSVREGLPRSILEAMSHGVPVIGTDTRGIRDLLSDGHGVLVPPRDPPALAAALKRLATSASTREAIGRKAWERSHQYSIERVLECHRKVYGRFLSATR